MERRSGLLRHFEQSRIEVVGFARISIEAARIDKAHLIALALQCLSGTSRRYEA